MILAAMLIALQEPPAQRPLDWEERDAEGRYALFAADYAQRQDLAIDAWVPVLHQDKDWVVLEWIATSIPLGSGSALDALVAADAPNWLRVADYRTRFVDSHSASSGLDAMKAQPAKSAAWARFHVDLVARKTRDFANDATGADAPDITRYEAPISPAAVLDPIRRGLSAIEFGDRKQAAVGELYLHQVQRSIRMLQHGDHGDATIDQALVRLVEEGDIRIAAPAALAFSYFLTPRAPSERLFALSEREDLEPERRSAAFLAASYGHWPVASLELHIVLDQRDHPHWTIALSRIVEIADPLSEWVLLERMNAEEEGTPVYGTLDAALMRARGDATLDANPHEFVLAFLERVARAELVSGWEWMRWETHRYFERRMDKPQLRAVLEGLPAGLPEDLPQPLRERVIFLAGELLGS